MAKKPGKQDKHGHNFVLAKPLDKHGITLVHIIYPPLGGLVGLFSDRGPKHLETSIWGQNLNLYVADTFTRSQ